MAHYRVEMRSPLTGEIWVSDPLPAGEAAGLYRHYIDIAHDTDDNPLVVTLTDLEYDELVGTYENRRHIRYTLEGE